MIGSWKDAAATLRREARSFGELASDVGRYAVGRFRERYLGARATHDPVREILDRALADVAVGTIEARVAVSRAIAEEKRLGFELKLAVRRVDAWARRAAEARGEGDESLALEAAAGEARHREAAATQRRLWSHQLAEAKKLKDALRAIHDRTEDARRARDRILAQRNVARARTEMQRELKRLEEVIRLLDRLSSDEVAPAAARDDTLN